MIKRYVATLFFAVLMLNTGCQQNHAKQQIEAMNQPDIATTQHQKAVALIEKNKLEDALLLLEEVELMYPGADVVSDAMYLRAKNLYRLSRFDESNAVIQHFIKQFPADKRAEELLFLRAINYYSRVMDTKRDQRMAHAALKAFNEFIQRFPESKQVVESRFKIDYLEAAIAGKEMDVAYFYYDKKNYSAALRRFKNVAEYHETTIFAPEALYRIAEIMLLLNLPEQAKHYAAILGANFVDSEWYHKLYKIMDDR